MTNKNRKLLKVFIVKKENGMFNFPFRRCKTFKLSHKSYTDT